MMKITRFARPVTSAIYAVITLYFRKKNAVTTVAGLRLRTMLDVQHPRFSPSNKVLVRYLEKLRLQNTHVLDVGTGSGIIGIVAAKKGAQVLAVDMNPLAVQLARENAGGHGLKDKMQSLESDLFSKILPAQKFDYIIFNPLVYISRPKSFRKSALNAGNNGETTARFLEQAKTFLTEKSKIILMLSSEMSLPRIDKKIRQSGFIVASVTRSAHYFEYFYILELQVA
ncbi:MAG: methyltransferase [bacterium]